MTASPLHSAGGRSWPVAFAVAVGTGDAHAAHQLRIGIGGAELFFDIAVAAILGTEGERALFFRPGQEYPDDGKRMIALSRLWKRVRRPK